MPGSRFKRLVDQLAIRPIRRSTLVQQTEAAECGLACLAMMCRHYGKPVDLMSLRHQYARSSRGTTLASLCDIAQQLGLATRPLSLDLDEITALRLPCLLHWEFNHFVVLVRVSRRRITLDDPALGRRHLTWKAFSNGFTGVALEAWPDSHFTPMAVRHQFSPGKLLRGVHGLKPALAKIFCLSLVLESITLLLPVGTQLVMDHAIPANDRSLLTLICLALLLFILLQGAVSMVRVWSSLVLGTLINVQWQSKLFTHLLRLPLDYFARRKLGDIQARFASLGALRDTFTASIVGAMMDSIMVVGVLVMMLLYGGWLTAVVTAFMLIYVLIRLVSYPYYRALSEEALVKDARASSFFMETLFGIGTVKMQGMGARRAEHWLNLHIDSINTGIRLSKVEMLLGGLNSLIVACDNVVILWLGTRLVMDNQMTLGMFVAFGVFRSQFSDRIRSLIEFLLQLRMTSLHNERIADIALHQPEPRRVDIPYLAALQPVTLQVHALHYGYEGDAPRVLHDLTFTLAAGESVALVGPSGCGKTTLMKVLCGLIRPDSGRIEVDGIDIQQLGINNYQKRIACVMQDDKLFAGSIRQNICAFSEEVDEAWMLTCARMSALHEVIDALPMRYETLVGELGEGLSGGQKQRLFIARALYKKPGLLLMDEATSALDAESEHQVSLAIKQLCITRLIIAHRQTTIASADRVIVLSPPNAIAHAAR
ncbi:peptidase domain-containing ABC transporter [Pantoea sp. Mb-10]|uniref:peptidase domain-containing ABC transporter n=1 Tax=unclassified Pantoea TaxID=2630326 RepID=UPI001E509C65|nr:MULTISPECIES: peptidase domain-containing ABC transporter [unclassified Pantoea]MCE0491270.1 peptidase domain-containing ABC transporter [Pantoea sp. Mb-10]MCE0502759.1 peptidase domain-containing ABC transporter [Pantoea sp. Pb-8]